MLTTGYMNRRPGVRRDAAYLLLCHCLDDLGRAIVRQPQAFLLDEPLSNLDARLRVQTRAELARMHRQLGATMLYVTHDQEEAMTLGDRIAVICEGCLQQVAPPMDVYRRPANRFVASFVGSPAMNFFDCRILAEGSRYRLECPSFTLTLEEVLDLRPPRDIVLGVRPQDVRLAEAGEADVKARVDVVQPLGGEMLVYLNLPGTAEGASLALVLPSERTVKVDEVLGVRFLRDRLHLFDPKEGSRLN
jgi:ABC-type sugar transport system ATPase subunit